MPISESKLEKPTAVPDLLGLGLSTKPDEHAIVSLDTKFTWHDLDDAYMRPKH